MSWIITGAEKNKGLLDEFSGAAAAYSLRDLSVRRNAPVVRVRRSSDNTEQDFTATQVTDGTLTAFCGAGDGFVRVWYDQTTNGINAEQSVAASQPSIVTGGAINTRNGKPTVTFSSSGSGTFLSNPTIFNSGAYSAFITADYQQGCYLILPRTTPPTASVREIFGLPSDPTYADITLNGNTGGFNLTQSLGDQILMTVLFDGSIYAPYVNAQQKTITSTGPVAYDAEYFGFGRRATQNTLKMNGNYQELILYFSNKAADRAAIESNINAHYSIF